MDQDYEEAQFEEVTAEDWISPDKSPLRLTEVKTTGTPFTPRSIQWADETGAPLSESTTTPRWIHPDDAMSPSPVPEHAAAQSAAAEEAEELAFTQAQAAKEAQRRRDAWRAEYNQRLQQEHRAKEEAVGSKGDEVKVDMAVAMVDDAQVRPDSNTNTSQEKMKKKLRDTRKSQRKTTSVNDPQEAKSYFRIAREKRESERRKRQDEMTKSERDADFDRRLWQEAEVRGTTLILALLRDRLLSVTSRVSLSNPQTEGCTPPTASVSIASPSSHLNDTRETADGEQGSISRPLFDTNPLHATIITLSCIIALTLQTFAPGTQVKE